MIRFSDGCFFLEGKDISYVMKLTKEGYLLSCHFGRKIAPVPPKSVPGRV